jgi:hypothetical protein
MSQDTNDNFPIHCSHCREEVASCQCDGGIGSPFWTDDELKQMCASRHDVFEDYTGPNANEVLNHNHVGRSDLDATHGALDKVVLTLGQPDGYKLNHDQPIQSDGVIVLEDLDAAYDAIDQRHKEQNEKSS